MSEEDKRVANYFVVAGLPLENPQPLEEGNVEVNLKHSVYQDPITDITVIFPSLGETVPDHYQMIDMTSTGNSANLNHGSFRTPEVFLCFRRGRHVPPLVEVGVFYDKKDKLLPDTQIVQFSHQSNNANVNNTANLSTYLTYRRATKSSPCDELVVMDICVILASKGESPPHSFKKIDKSLNRGSLMGSDVYICYKKSVDKANIISYKPALLSQFPIKRREVEEEAGDVEENKTNFKIDDNVALFCLPMGATLECWPADRSRPSRTTSKFVLSPTNSPKIYGSAITFYEDFKDLDRLAEEQVKGLRMSKYHKKMDHKIFVNKCICILSHWPFFEAFENFLFFLCDNQVLGKSEIPLERYISQFLYDVPFPSPSRPRILYQLNPETCIALFQPEELPLPRSGASFRNLLTSLGPDNCLLVLLLALTEQKILLHSFRPDILTSVAEAIKQIIFPFYWQCPYIPLCPIGMSDYLAAPLPFVIGLDSRFFDLYDQPHDVNAVDLDTQTITLGSEKASTYTAKLLPKRAARTLRASLVSLLEKCDEHEALMQEPEVKNNEAIDYVFTMKRKEMHLELNIRDVFLRFMVTILSGYRNYLLPITKAPTVGATDVINLFDSTSFIHSRDRSYHKFYVMLMRTQMFTKFIEERSFVSDVNAYLAFFDECIEKFERGQSKFLELEGVENERTVFILPPDASDLPPGKVYTYNKIEDLDPNLFFGPNWKDKKGGSTDAICDLSYQGSGNVDMDSAEIFSTPLAKRTKQEVRSAQKTAVNVHQNADLWAKCLVNTCYSLWFIHLPSYILHENGRPTSLKAGFSILKRMRSLCLHPADEICYRVMMQLCGVYHQPSLAVSVLMEMKDCSLHPNAVTYGYYNKAVLECEWPKGPKSLGQIKWNKIKYTLRAFKLFREAAMVRRQRQQQLTPSVPFKQEADNVSRASSVESGVSQESSNLVKEDEDKGTTTYDVGYSSMNENNGKPSLLNDEHKLMSSASLANNVTIEECGENKDISQQKFNVKKGPQRALFQKSGSEELEAGVGDNLDSSCCTSSSFTSSKSRSQSVGSESAATLTCGSALLEPVPELIGGSGSCISPMIGTPVTANDPLGALLPKEKLGVVICGGVKASNSYSTLSSSKLDDNILGEPFSDLKLSADGGPLARSSTLPRSLYEEAEKSISPFSLKNFSKSGMTSRLKQGSSFLINSLSPNTKTTQEVFTSFRSNVSSAATHIKAKYLDPAAGTDEYLDRLSVGSNDSRRTSEAAIPSTVNGELELWSSFAGSIWEKWMGTTLSTDLPKPQSLTSIRDRFEKHYTSIPKALFHPIALVLEMTTVTRCLVCDSVVYDEEIIAGWTAEDSNLNTKCVFCSKLFVPSISIRVKDYRNRPSSLAYNYSIPAPKEKFPSSRRPRRRCGSSNFRSQSECRSLGKDKSVNRPPPQIIDGITVPYLSPLVLRKELESILEREGDQCLNDPNCVDDHPIVFWNMVWYFHRIDVKSHIIGSCLKARSLNSDKHSHHPSWKNANQHNIVVKCLWDNPDVHKDHSSYLYMQYGTPELGASPLVRSFLYSDSQLSSRIRIKKITEGVAMDKLVEPMKLFLEERRHFKETRHPVRRPSMYRDILFLTLAINGCDNINYGAFDRIYKATLSELRPTYQDFIYKSDEIPDDKALICRRYFKDLIL